MPTADRAAERTSRVPAVSRRILRVFLLIVRLRLGRAFHAVRGHAVERLRNQTGPLILYMNHSSWWDPMLGFLLWAQLPSRRHFGPMDAAALRRYPILSRVGVFPVDPATARGGIQFLRTAEEILRSGGVLWLTPQGRFADVRDRPPILKPGLAALALRVPGCTLIPLAFEYPFWDESTPEALVAVGEPQHALPGESAPALEARLAAALDHTMGELAARARTRNPASFSTTLLRGRAGVGGFYGLGQRLHALLLRRPYQPEHTLSPEPDQLDEPTPTHLNHPRQTSA